MWWWRDEVTRANNNSYRRLLRSQSRCSNTWDPFIPSSAPSFTCKSNCVHIQKIYSYTGKNEWNKETYRELNRKNTEGKRKYTGRLQKTEKEGSNTESEEKRLYQGSEERKHAGNNDIKGRRTRKERRKTAVEQEGGTAYRKKMGRKSIQDGRKLIRSKVGKKEVYRKLGRKDT